MERPERERGKADPEMHEMRHNNYRELHNHSIEVAWERQIISNIATPLKRKQYDFFLQRGEAEVG